MLTNELQPKHKTDHYALLPYLPGHDYVLLPGVGDGQVRIAYSEVVPTSLQKYAYMTNLSHPEVILNTLSAKSNLTTKTSQVLVNPVENGLLEIATSNKFSALADSEVVSLMIMSGNKLNIIFIFNLD